MGATWRSLLQYSAAWCNLVQVGASWCSLVQLGAGRFNLVQLGENWCRLVVREMSFVHHSPVSRPLINTEENIDCKCQDCLACLVNSYELTVFDGYEGDEENQEYQVGGLIFSNKRDYEFFKKIDEKIFYIVKKLKKEEDGIKKLEELFDRIYELDVTESYEEATEEIDGLFPNATELLSYEFSPGLALDYKAACLFFEKFNYII